MNFIIRAITLDLDDTVWPFAPIAALLPTAVFTVGAIWSRTCADLALGALAAAMFGVTAILTFIAVVTSI